MALPLIVLLWATSCYDSLPLCGHWGCWLRITAVLVGDVKSPTCPAWSITPASRWVHEPIGGCTGMAWDMWIYKNFCKTHTHTQRKEHGAKMSVQSWGRWSENAGQRIWLHFPFFMYLWHVIKSGRLDREITPCLPTNKPPASVSSPLFIIHNLLWCQGQSDCIVMVKGKSGDPQISTKQGLKFQDPDHQKRLEWDDLVSNQPPSKTDRVEGGKSDVIRQSKLLEKSLKIKQNLEEKKKVEFWICRYDIFFSYFYFKTSCTLILIRVLGLN